MSAQDWWAWFWGIPPPPKQPEDSSEAKTGEDDEELEKDGIYNADFETAMTEAGFGRFHILLMAVTVMIGWAYALGLSIMPYMSPVYYCDLHLDPVRVSQLYAIPYFGIITSSLLWGYIADTMGRKIMIMSSLFLNCIFTCISSLSQLFVSLMFTQYFAGAMVAGCHHIMLSYTAEFVSTKYRARYVLIQTGLINYALLYLAACCLYVLPAKIKFNVFYYLELEAWSVIMLMSLIPNLLAFIGMIFLPESPTFLLYLNEPHAALAVYKYVNKMNHPKTWQSFRVKSLKKTYDGGAQSTMDVLTVHTETDSLTKKFYKRTLREAFEAGKKQLKLLFSKVYLGKLMLMTLVLVLLTIGLNIFSSWIPAMLTKMAEEQIEKPVYCTAISALIRDIEKKRHNVNFTRKVKLASARLPRSIENIKCYEAEIAIRDYRSSMIIEGCAFFFFAVQTCILRFAERRLWILTNVSLGGMLGIILYLTRRGYRVYVGFSTFIVGFAYVSYAIMITIVLDVFPTEVRTMAVSAVNMFGYCGPLIGNSVWPILAEKIGCVAPFTMISGTFMITASLAFLLPREPDIMKIRE